MRASKEDETASSLAHLTRGGSVRTPPPGPCGFTVGICASDSAERLPALIALVRSESYGEFEMRRLVVVASGVPQRVVDEARAAAGRDPAFEVIVEPERKGKAEALNLIIERSVGRYLVLLNADAIPEPGAIREVLGEAEGDPGVGCVSAEPILEERGDMLSRSLNLMWSAHCLMSLNLNHAGLSNHACDELMAVKRALLGPLPPDLVNDGAYIGGRARRAGYAVKFTTKAKVKIEVPSRPIDLIRQRRRIIFGHLQVWRSLGRAPRTVESMLFMGPAVSARTLVRLLAAKPRLMAVLPVVVTGEFLASSMAVLDVARSTESHAVWRRVSR